MDIDDLQQGSEMRFFDVRVRVVEIGLKQFRRFHFHPFERFQARPSLDRRIIIINQAIHPLLICLVRSEVRITPFFFLLLLDDDIHHSVQALLASEYAFSGFVFKEGAVDEAFALGELFLNLLPQFLDPFIHQWQQLWCKILRNRILSKSAVKQRLLKLLLSQLILLLLAFLLILALPFRLLEEDIVNDLLLELRSQPLQPLVGIAIPITYKIILQFAILLKEVMQILLV